MQRTLVREISWSLRLIATVMLCLGSSLADVVAGPLENAQAALLRGDYAKAAALYQVVAEKGNTAAQYNLGVMYAKGEGVSQDYGEAQKWLRRSADQGYGRAQYLLGEMHAKGVGTTADKVSAYKWLSLAARQGLPQAVQMQADFKKGMTPAEISDGETAVRSWKVSSEVQAR